MAEDVAGSASDAANGMQVGGLIARLQERGAELAKGRRVTIPLPGYDDLGDGRGLWARFMPLSRKMQQEFAWTPSSENQEIDVVAPMIAFACEEIMIGTYDARTPLADEPEVKAARAGGPLRFDAELGELLGVGGTDGASVVKRVLIRGDDDLPLYGVWAELLHWSTSVHSTGVETAAGE